MERETIMYRGKKYHRYPSSERRQLRVYFWRHDLWKLAPVSLHRQIYIDNFGEIPKEYCIHHRDHNPLNNSPDNLEAKPRGQHNSDHMRDPNGWLAKHRNTPEFKKQLTAARELTKIWHASPEGHAWHIANGFNGWKNRKPRTVVCRYCQNEFQAFKYDAAVCGKRLCKNRRQVDYMRTRRLQSSG